MNIVDLLIEDHDKMRLALTKINQNLAQRNLIERLKNFIGQYELYESIEEEILFPSLGALRKTTEGGEILFDYEKDHTTMWAVMDSLRDAILSGRSSAIQESFFKFNAFTEAHLRCEERILFPMIRENVSSELLEELGQKAEEKMKKLIQA